MQLARREWCRLQVRRDPPAGDPTGGGEEHTAGLQLDIGEPDDGAIG